MNVWASRFHVDAGDGLTQFLHTINDVCGQMTFASEQQCTIM